MTRHAVALVWLLVVWLGLWRDLSPANVASGLVLGAAVLALFPLPPAHQRLRVRPVALLRFVVAFTTSVVKANLIVAWEVVTPRNQINEGIVAVPLATSDPVVITLISHAIILAPGTMVIDIDRDPSTVLFVHVLHLRSPDGVRRDVQALERLASAAVGAPTPHGGAEVAA